MGALLRVVLVLLAVWLPVMSHGRFQDVGDKPKGYTRGRDTMLFAVVIRGGGDAVAGDIAKKYHFENKGKVGKSIVLVSRIS